MLADVRTGGQQIKRLTLYRFGLTPRGRRRLDEMCDHWRRFARKIDRLVAAAREQ